MDAVEPFGPEAMSTQDRTESELLAMAETPSYLKRARAVEEERRQLNLRCGRARESMLGEVRLALLEWNRLVLDKPLECARGVTQFGPTIERLGDLVFPPGARRTSRGGHGLFWSPRRSLRRIARAVARFNPRWKAFAEQVDFAPLNRVIAAYNRNYVFEKECALRNARLAQMGFQPLPPANLDWLLQQFPLLPELDVP